MRSNLKFSKSRFGQAAHKRRSSMAVDGAVRPYLAGLVSAGNSAGRDGGEVQRSGLGEGEDR